MRIRNKVDKIIVHSQRQVSSITTVCVGGGWTLSLCAYDQDFSQRVKRGWPTPFMTSVLFDVVLNSTKNALVFQSPPPPLYDTNRFYSITVHGKRLSSIGIMSVCGIEDVDTYNGNINGVAVLYKDAWLPSYNN